MYARFTCGVYNNITTIAGIEITRSTIAYTAVATNLLVMLTFLLALWFMSYSVKVDIQRHKNKFFETSEFAVMFKMAPNLNEELTLMELKAELWDKITCSIRDHH